MAERKEAWVEPTTPVSECRIVKLNEHGVVRVVAGAFASAMYPGQSWIRLESSDRVAEGGHRYVPGGPEHALQAVVFHHLHPGVA